MDCNIICSAIIVVAMKDSDSDREREKLCTHAPTEATLGQEGSVTHRGSVKRDMDPNLQLPFASVPSSMRPTFDFLDPLAIYYCGLTAQLIGRERKTLATFVTKDSIFFAKKDSGALARRVPFTVIRAMHSNLGGGRTAAVADKRFEPFMMLLLSPQERTDIILLGESCESFLINFKKIWEATGFGGRCVLEEAPLKWKKFTDFQQNYRVPQSSREGTPSVANVERREHILKAFNEHVMMQDFPEDGTAAGSGVNSSPPPSVLSSPARAVTFRDPNTGAESPKMIAFVDHKKFNQHVELPYVTFSEDERVAFPTMSEPDRALYYCERHYVFNTTDNSSGGKSSSSNTSSGALTDCFVLLSQSHLYCAVSEARVLRCCALKHVHRLWWVRDVSAAPFPASGSVVPDKANAYSILVQFVEVQTPEELSSSPAASRRSPVSNARVEHDVLIVFASEASMKAFSNVLEQIMLRAHPTNGARFQLSATLGLTSALLSPQDGFELNVAPLPIKLDAASSEALLRAKGGVTRLSGTGGSGSVLKRNGSAVSTEHNTLSSRKSALSLNFSGSMRQQPSAEQYEGLMSIVKNDPQLLEEFPVTSDLQERHPPLATGSVFWASRVVFHPSPLRKQAGQRSSELVVAFLTKSQFVVGNNGEHLRIMPVKAITAIRVKTISRKSGEHNRQVIVLVGNSQEHDLCIEIDREDEGRVMLNQLLTVIKKSDPYNVPAIRSFQDVEAENFRFEANKFYKAPELDLPLSFDTIAYRREIRQRVVNLYQRYNAQKVDRVDGLMKEYVGRELELLEKLRQKFGVSASDVEESNEDLFGYRKRLVAFCEKYLPESIDSVDRVLREYRGQEDRLFDILVRRFGPEPKEPVITPAAKQAALRREQSRATLVVMAPKDRLLRMYQTYQPSKIGMIDEILARYKGSEDVLFRKLEKLYGPEPEVDPAAAKASKPQPAATAASSGEPSSAVEAQSLGDRVAAMCRRYTPGKINTIPSVLEQFKGREQILLDGLVKKYGPEPIPCTQQSRDRLAAFFSNHMAERMPDERLDEILSSFRGSEAELYASLAKRYGATGPFSPKGGVSDEKRSKKREKAKVIASSSSDDENADGRGGAGSRLRAAFDVYNKDGSPAQGETERVVQAKRRQIDAMARTSGSAKNTVKEDNLSTDILESIDMLTELPYVDVPTPVQHMFPSFGRAAIFLFDRVLHWEPGMPPALRYLYLTVSHVYIASSETMVHRCIAVRDLQAVFLTTKRDDMDSQCSVLLKVYPKEHDCFFSVESDFDAKRFVWLLMEVMHKYHQHASCAVTPVRSLLDKVVNAQCKPSASFEVSIAPVKKRHRTLNPPEGKGSQALQELFSRLHEAVIEKRYDEEADALLDVQEAALISKPSRGLLELNARDKKIFGLGGSARNPSIHIAAASPQRRDADAMMGMDNEQLGISDYQATLLSGEPRKSVGGGVGFLHHDGGDGMRSPGGDRFADYDDTTDQHREIQRRRLNPIQRRQFFVHSHSGFYGTAVGGSLLGVASPGVVDGLGEISGSGGGEGDQQMAGGLQFSEFDDPKNVATGSLGQQRDASHVDAAPMGREAALMEQGVLGVSEDFEPSPIDKLGHRHRGGPPASHRTPFGFSTPSLPRNVLAVQQHASPGTLRAHGDGSLKQRMANAAQAATARVAAGGSPSWAHGTYASVAVAPPPERQLRLADTSADFYDATTDGSPLRVRSHASEVDGQGQGQTGENQYRRFLLESLV